jgi:hypothetical protein
MGVWHEGGACQRSRFNPCRWRCVSCVVLWCVALWCVVCPVVFCCVVLPPPPPPSSAGGHTTNSTWQLAWSSAGLQQRPASKLPTGSQVTAGEGWVGAQHGWLCQAQRRCAREGARQGGVQQGHCFHFR